MPLVNVMVNARAYTVACDEGEEGHLRELAKLLDARVRQLVESVGQVGDARLLLMAGLLIADELHEALGELATRESDLGGLKGKRANMAERRDGEDSGTAEMIETAARRLEDIAARVARA